jgi:hypothetical protein
MVYANGVVILHRIPAKQRYVELPSELLDRSPGSDTVYLMMNPLAF